MAIAVLCSRVRVEEKALFAALDKRGVEYQRLDPREFSLQLGSGKLAEYDTGLMRCISQSHAYYMAHWLDRVGVPVVNTHSVIATCGDKFLTSVVLQEQGLPVPRTALALTPEAALEAIEEMGYPVVLKPVAGSWGRLLAKVNDREAAEAIIEHKTTLGGEAHGAFYVQEYVDKPARDIRTMVVDQEVVYAIYRYSEHWITNTARGGAPQLCPLSDEVCAASLAAANAVGGGVLAVDLLESATGQLLINEINHTPEFHGAMQATDVDIAGKIVDHVLQSAREKGNAN